MQQQEFNGIMGMITHGINRPVQSCQDALNVVFTSNGVCEKRIGRQTIGLYDYKPDKNQQLWIDSGEDAPAIEARNTSFLNAYSYRQPNIPLAYYNGISAFNTHQAGLKVDRYSPYSDYNPKAGFSDVVISFTGISYFGWIGNNGYSQGLNISYSDLYKVLNGGKSYVDGGVKGDYTPMFSTVPSKLFDSAICYPNYTFVPINSYSCISGDNNLVYRNIQLKDIVTGYNTSTPPTYSANEIVNPELPARCWVLDHVPNVALSVGVIENTFDGSGWLPENYAIDVYCRVSVRREDGSIIYGKNSGTITIRNSVDGFGIPIITPTIEEYLTHTVLTQNGATYQSKFFEDSYATIEVFRTKKYKWRGFNIEIPPTTFYKCYSRSLTGYNFGLQTINNLLTPEYTTTFQPEEITGIPRLGVKALANFGIDVGTGGNVVYKYGGLLTFNSWAFPANEGITVVSIKCSAVPNAESVPASKYYNQGWEVLICTGNVINNTVINPKVKAILKDKNVAEVNFILDNPNINFMLDGYLSSIEIGEIRAYKGFKLELTDEALYETDVVPAFYPSPLSIGKCSYNGSVYHYNIVTPAVKSLNLIGMPIIDENELPHNLQHSVEFIQNSDATEQNGQVYQDVTHTFYDSFNFHNLPIICNNYNPNFWIGFSQTVLNTSINCLTKQITQLKNQYSGELTDGYIRQFTGEDIGVMDFKFDATVPSGSIGFKTPPKKPIPSSGVGILLFSNKYGYTTNLVAIFTYTSYSITAGDGTRIPASRRVYKFENIVSYHPSLLELYGEREVGTTIHGIFLEGSGFNNIPLWFGRYNVNSVTLPDEVSPISSLIFGEACYPKIGTDGDTFAYTMVEDTPHAVLATGSMTGYDHSYLNINSFISRVSGGVLQYRVPLLTTVYLKGLVYNAFTPAQGYAQDLNNFVNKAQEKKYRASFLSGLFKTDFFWSRYTPLQLTLMNNKIGKHWRGVTSFADTNELKLAKNGQDIFDISVVNVPNTNEIPDNASLTNVAEASYHYPAGILVSRDKDLNRVTPYIAPYEIGDTDKPITCMWVFNGILYCSKENEGIFKLYDNGTTIVGDKIDNSRYVLSPKSVCVNKDFVYFLSNRGVSAMNKSENIEDISEAIQENILNIINTIKAEEV